MAAAAVPPAVALRLYCTRRRHRAAAPLLWQLANSRPQAHDLMFRKSAMPVGSSTLAMSSSTTGHGARGGCL